MTVEPGHEMRGCHEAVGVLHNLCALIPSTHSLSASSRNMQRAVVFFWFSELTRRSLTNASFNSTRELEQRSTCGHHTGTTTRSRSCGPRPSTTSWTAPSTNPSTAAQTSGITTYFVIPSDRNGCEHRISRLRPIHRSCRWPEHPLSCDL